MNTVRCLLVDDEPVASRILEGYLGDIDGYEVVATCANATEAYGVLRQMEVDLMFLDIEMPRVKGLDFLKSLKNPPRVVLTTAYREFALESYELDVLDYLLKPISLERFLKALDKFNSAETRKRPVFTREEEQDGEAFFIKSEGKMVRVDPVNILYVEGLGNYVKIVREADNLIYYSSMKEIAEKFPPDFVRIHRSYIVNINKIEAFTPNHVEVGGEELNVTGTYRDDLLEKLDKLHL